MQAVIKPLNIAQEQERLQQQAKVQELEHQPSPVDTGEHKRKTKLDNCQGQLAKSMAEAPQNAAAAAAKVQKGLSVLRQGMQRCVLIAAYTGVTCLSHSLATSVYSFSCVVC